VGGALTLALRVVGDGGVIVAGCAAGAIVGASDDRTERASRYARRERRGFSLERITDETG
jgi:hypothetical protein